MAGQRARAVQSGLWEKLESFQTQGASVTYFVCLSQRWGLKYRQRIQTDSPLTEWSRYCRVLSLSGTRRSVDSWPHYKC